ncbi:MAG: DUF5620 domain-containing protein [Oscillospiraceae bacterium]|nr:DUF5620 domain-containing protein [Oscillospiraceae bacterium]
MKIFSSKAKAVVLSLMLAATAVPMYSVSAVSLSNDAVSVSNKNAGDITVTEGDDGKYIGYTADIATSGIKTITFTCTADKTCNISYGFGIGVADSPYWYEWNGKEWSEDGAGTEVSVTEGKEFTITLDVSDLTLSYNPSTNQYPGKFEFRNYTKGVTITISSIKANDTSAPTNPDDPKQEVDRNNRQSGDWSFTDNKDGTATITSTVSRQLDGLSYLLTAGYDEDTYASSGEEFIEGESPINSHKFKYTDFGITDLTGITIESLLCVCETEEGVEADTFMYGGGLNVQNGSAADTEYAKGVAGIEGKEGAGYWYNDMGAEQLAEFEAKGVEFGVTPGEGVTLKGAGNYIECYWEVPKEVQPYVTTRPVDQISFQFWYGEEVADDYTVLPSVTLTSAVLTYTIEKTVPYTGSVESALNEALDYTDETLNSLHVSYADLGIEKDMDVYAIRFDISASKDVKKLVYSPGTGVTDGEAYDYWFQEETNYCVLDAGQSKEIMWIVPTEVSGSNSETNLVNPDGELYFGYYYGEADSITIDNVEVYYDIPETTTTTTAPVTTTTTSTTTTTTTTTAPVTTTQPATTTDPGIVPEIWGDADDNGEVNINDVVVIMAYANDDSNEFVNKKAELQADVFKNGDGVNASDAVSVQKFLAKILPELPESFMD